MPKIKAKLKLEPETLLHLGKYKDVDEKMSDIINDYFLKSRNEGVPKSILLTRAYLNNARPKRVEYSKAEFINHFLNDDKFNELYDDYVKTNYDKQYLPSFKVHKELEKTKVMKYSKVMRNQKNSKPVIRDYYGDITKYNSINEAARQLDLHPMTVRKMIKNNLPHRGDENDRLYYA